MKTKKQKIEKPSPWKEWDKTLPWGEFLKFVKPYKHIRVGVDGNAAPPFNFLYFRISKRELIKTVRMHQAEVNFDVIFDTNNLDDIGTMFIHSVRITLLDEKTKIER